MPGRGEPLTGYNHRCPVCGKEFWAYADWIYRKWNKAERTKIYYCSWKCIRSIETLSEDETRRQSERK